MEKDIFIAIRIKGLSNRYGKIDSFCVDQKNIGKYF